MTDPTAAVEPDPEFAIGPDWAKYPHCCGKPEGCTIIDGCAFLNSPRKTVLHQPPDIPCARCGLGPGKTVHQIGHPYEEPTDA